MKKIIIIILKIIGALSLVAFLALFAAYQWLFYKDDQILAENKFDQRLWVEAGIEDAGNNYRKFHHHQYQCTRGKMYYDLVENHLKKGMSKDKLLELLGKPNYGLKYPNNKKRQYCLEYELGGCTVWFSGPGKILSVCIENDRVVEIFYDSRNNEAEDFNIK